jgi:cyclopropane-fatty-acyl-phospholipid synthase
MLDISNMTLELMHALQAGKAAAQDLLGKESDLLVNPKQMIPSWSEAGARLLVTRFLGQYVSVGNLV